MKGKQEDGSGDIKKTKMESNLEDFALKEVLRIDSERKVAFLHATHREKGDSAAIILEKKAFKAETVEKFLSGGRLESLTQNDIYGNFDYFPSPEVNDLKCTLIHPATKRHIDRLRQQEMFLTQETPELYRNTVLPFINNEAPFSHEWVYNLLDGKAEQDRVIFQDPDPQTGFALAMDLKWDGKTLESLYIQAMVHRRDIKSIRDLTPEHLPLLKNIRTASLKAIQDKYGLKSDRIRAYFHYHPTYYHLHVHFVTMQWDAPAFGADRAHLLDRVIDNLEHYPDYYQKATLLICLGENDPLLNKIRAATNN